MNVRIEDQKIRFKISEEEMHLLQSGQCLDMALELFDRSMRIIIKSDGLGENISVTQDIDGGVVFLNLDVPSKRLSELAEMGKSREGIDVMQGALCVSLQVDMRKDSRPREKSC